MNSIKLTDNISNDVTVIKNEFIDKYMVNASGEFVKVYLLLLRYMQDNDSSLTISSIADCLNNTEGDVLIALSYWESEGILHMKNNKNGITEIVLGNNVRNKEVSFKETSSISPEKKPSAAVPKKAGAFKKSPEELKEFKSLLFIAEQYLGRTLSKTDIDLITFFYDDLEMPVDLIEYLIESCVENNHKSIHYIRAVGLNWFESNIKSVEQAKRETVGYGKNSYKIMKALGVNNRGPATSEEALIKKWLNEYGFSMDIVIEACNRTISAIHQPSFEYLDSILTNWYERNVHHLKDIVPLDNAHKANKEKKVETTSSAANNNFKKPNNSNNFTSREYDMDSLEEQLLD